MKKQIANVITICRILCSVCLLFCPMFSACFYIVYLVCGLTDMVDGTVARRTNAVSEFGARLDTVADIAFFSAASIKIFPAIHMQKWLWAWVSIIAVIKIGNYIWGMICHHKIISLHTISNKITGLFLFLLPLTTPFVGVHCSIPVVCAVSTFSVIQEGYYIGTGREIV